MKILQLIYSLSSGGAEKFVVNLSNELAKKGHKVLVCILLSEKDDSNVFNKKFLDPEVGFHSMQFARGFSLVKVFKLSKYILANNPDVVHCHLNVIPYVFPLSILRHRIKFIHTIHNVADKAVGLRSQRKINRWFYLHYITPVAISEKCKESFESFYNLRSVIKINNGCPPVEKTSLYSDVKGEILDMQKDAIRFIHVARFAEQKNQKLLVDAFNKLDALGYDFHLNVIGRGFFDSKEGRELMADACDRIHFLGEKTNVSDYLFCSNAFCLTSNYEGLPISLIEAMSCGLPAIATSVGGVPDVIEDGTNGYLCDNLSVGAYVGAVIKYINEPIAKEKVIAVYNKSFSIRRCAVDYDGLYRSKKMSAKKV